MTNEHAAIDPRDTFIYVGNILIPAAQAGITVTTCAECGKPIEFVEWTNGVLDMIGDSAWFDTDGKRTCGITPDSFEEYPHEPINEGW